MERVQLLHAPRQAREVVGRRHEVLPAAPHHRAAAADAVPELDQGDEPVDAAGGVREVEEERREPLQLVGVRIPVEHVLDMVDAHHLAQPQQQQEEGESLSNDKLPLHKRNPANLATPELASAWVKCHYPSLKFCAEENVDFAGLNALEFFHVFFATDAPYNFQELQKKRKDKDIVYGDWRSLGQAKQLSLHPKAQQLDQLNTTPYINERLITFKTKTGSYFGPPYADATKVQRALLASKKLLIIEARTTMKDVPYSDRFYIMERWIVTATKKNDMYHASLSIHSQVFFTKSCPFESQIVSKSQETFKEISSTWINMAHQALKLTEKARQIRLQQSSSRDPIQEIPKSESVEVKHTGSGSSVIVGENEKEQVRPESPKKKSSFRKSFSKMVKKRRNSLSSTLTGSASS